MLKLNSLGGKYSGVDNEGAVLVSVMKLNQLSVKFLIQRCSSNKTEERVAVHRVIIGRTSVQSSKYEGEQVQLEGEDNFTANRIKRMELTQLEGDEQPYRSKYVVIKIEEYRYTCEMLLKFSYSLILLRFPKSEEELKEGTEIDRLVFASTYSFKLVKGDFQLFVCLENCSNNEMVNHEYRREDKLFRKYKEPMMEFQRRILLSKVDIVENNESASDLMQSQDDYIFAFVNSQEMEKDDDPDEDSNNGISNELAIEDNAIADLVSGSSENVPVNEFVIIGARKSACYKYFMSSSALRMM